MQRLILSIVVAALLAPAAIALGPDTLQNATSTHYIVGFYEYPKDIKPGDSWQGEPVLKVEPTLRFIVVDAHTPLFVARAKTDDQVRYIHEDAYDFHADLTPNDPLYASNQYGPQKIGAPAAWDQTLGSTSIKLCVTDTGLRATHQDISGRVVNGWNFDAGTSNYADGNGHGTHVTTTAAGITNNGVGIAGIAQASVLVAKVLNDAGSGTYSAIASGIRWCADQGGKVISSSLGGSVGDVSLSDAVTYAWNAGSVLVAAAGNSGPCSNCVGYPAKYTNEIAVSCTDSANALCSFSSTGPEVDIAAPGYNIIAGWYTSDTATNTISGTSMSTPHVAGVAALVYSKNPTWTNTQVRSAIEGNAQDLGAAGLDSNFGYGLVRADLALGGGAPPPSCSGGPANNCFASPTSVAAGGATLTGSTTGATTETGEPAPCGGIGSTVWFTWTPTTSGSVNVDTTGSGYDTVAAVYTGSSLTGLTNVGCNDDIATGNTASKVTWTATAGTTYRIQLGGYNGATGSYTLKVTAAAGCASNDNFACATSVAKGSTTSRSTTGMTLETSEPRPCGSIGATVWYTYTPSTTGTVTVDTFTSNYDTVVSVYTGSSLTALTNVGCNDDTAGSGNGLQSRVVFTGTAGVTYRIQAGGYNSATGSLVLHVN